MLIDIVTESSIAELEITEGEEKIKIVKDYHTPQTKNHTVMLGSPPTSASLQNQATPILQADSALNHSNHSNSNIATATTNKPITAEEKLIKSPMVGTFYAASGPDKPNFVNIGTEVKANQTVCIIEAMKLLNEIESGVEGTIIEILVKNGMPVEFGQALFKVN